MTSEILNFAEKNQSSTNLFKGTNTTNTNCKRERTWTVLGKSASASSCKIYSRILAKVISFSKDAWLKPTVLRTQTPTPLLWLTTSLVDYQTRKSSLFTIRDKQPPRWDYWNTLTMFLELKVLTNSGKRIQQLPRLLRIMRDSAPDINTLYNYPRLREVLAFEYHWNTSLASVKITVK